jgi:sphingomyelin phosphodiesterase acid-like 3
MTRWWQYLLFLIVIAVFSFVGCGVVSTTTPSPDSSSTYQIAAISDLHFNPLYDKTLYSQLVNAPTSQWTNIYKTSQLTTPSSGGTDTNYPLLAYMLASVQKNLPNTNNSPVVLFTGDLLGHNIPQIFCTDYFLSQSLAVPSTCATANAGQTPIPASGQPLSTLINPFIDNTFAFVAQQIRNSVGTASVIYAPGNIDTYSGGYGPSQQFLTDNASTVYTQFLNGVGDEATFTSNFENDGYYSVQPLGSNLLVIALNSNSFVYGWPSYAGNATPEIAWLGQQLEAAQKAGQKVWILMHVPPGANAQEIAVLDPLPEDVNSSLFENEAEDMWNWDPGVQNSFTDLLNQYPGVVTMMLAGHTHMDEFRVLAPGYVVEQLPGISPCFGNNPAYKILTITQTTFTPTDYQSFAYNLASAQPLGFFPLYDFSTTYGAQTTLANSLMQLYPQLDSNQSSRSMYTFLYTSGADGVNPGTEQPWNPINDQNWPIFGCTIGGANESGYVGCVNPSQ